MPGLRRLTLLRHARAETHARSGQDIDRPLSPEGRAQAAALGDLLAAHEVEPELVLCSSAVRARQTWELSGTGGAPRVEVLPEIYGSDALELLDLVRRLGESASSVLLVGHEPVISHLAHLLAGDGSDEAAYARVSAGMSTAMLAFLTTGAAWAQLDQGGAVLTGLAAPQT